MVNVVTMKVVIWLAQGSENGKVTDFAEAHKTILLFQ